MVGELSVVLTETVKFDCRSLRITYTKKWDREQVLLSLDNMVIMWFVYES